jgi:hypothetical protein
MHHRAGREPKCQPAGECQAERLDPHRQDRKSLEQVLSYALSRHSRGNRACEKTNSTQITGIRPLPLTVLQCLRVELSYSSSLTAYSFLKVNKNPLSARWGMVSRSPEQGETICKLIESIERSESPAVDVQSAGIDRRS